MQGRYFISKLAWKEKTCIVSYSAVSTYILTWEFFNVFVIFTDNLRIIGCNYRRTGNVNCRQWDVNTQ